MYKLCLLVYKIMHNAGPSYLHERLRLYTRDRRLRPASHMQLVSHVALSAEWAERVFGLLAVSSSTAEH